MASALKYLPHYTYDDWLHWEGRWELIDGIPIAMSPMPVPSHQQTEADLIYEFKNALKTSCKDCKVYAPLDYKISDNTIIQPDVLVICGPINKTYLDFPPDLVIEILSKSTEERDRGIKYDYYEQEGVKYYLIVDWKKKSIEVYELINGNYTLQPYKNKFEFQSNDHCTISPELDNIWQ